jgi:hypothetical protein
MMLVETVMIELTEQQVRALENPQGAPPRVVNPRTKETFVTAAGGELRSRGLIPSKCHEASMNRSRPLRTNGMSFIG